MSETITETAGAAPAAAAEPVQSDPAAARARAADGKFAAKEQAQEPAKEPAKEQPKANGKDPAPEPKVEDGKSLLGTAANGEPAPIEYKDFTLPEGLPVDQTRMDAFKDLAAGARLTQEQAQKFLDAAAGHTRSMLEQQALGFRQQQEQMVAAVKLDKEIGGPMLPQVVQVAATAMDRFGTPALREALNATGAGNHPEMIRFCYRVGKALSESAFVSGGPAASTQPKSWAQTFYPDITK